MGTLLVTVATTWWARGKTRAEAARTVTEAALQLITPQTDRIARLEEAVGEYQRRVGALERRERESIAALAVHAEWDAAVAVMAIGAGQPLPPMPPLFPDALAHPRTRSSDRPADFVGGGR